MEVVGTKAPEVLSATTMIGDKVFNSEGKELGKLEELMLDLDRGCIAYAVLSFGGILGMGDKLFAIPWEAMRLDTDRHAFILNVNKDKLKDAPGFDKHHWPETDESIDRAKWLSEVYTYYGYEPYWK